MDTVVLYFVVSYSDGINQQLGGCMRDFRNKPFPVRTKIEYYNRVLTVSCAVYNSHIVEKWWSSGRFSNPNLK